MPARGTPWRRAHVAVADVLHLCMLLVILSPALCALVGLLMYVLASNPKLAEIGRLLMFAGILVLLLEAPAAINGTAAISTVRR